MNLIYENLVPLLWLAWGLYWFAAARDVKATRRHESPLSRAAHLVPLAVAVLLVAPDTLPGGFLCGRMFPASNVTYLSGVAIVAIGLAFAVWARLHLGRNWSATVTLKQGHELVRNGPYALVRHPIYTGLLIGFVGSAIARDEWRGLLAIAIVLVALWRKLKLEERWMMETFGERYAEYRRKTAALIPYLL